MRVTHKLESHPCVVTVEEMGAARHFVRTQFQTIPEEQRYQLLQPQLEINPGYLTCIKIITLLFSVLMGLLCVFRHPIIAKLHRMTKEGDSELAQLLAKQLFSFNSREK